MACPLVLRRRCLLMFRHPQAGVQLVKGSIGNGESVVAAALRELRAESRIIATPANQIFSSARIVPGQIWHFVTTAAPDLPDTWVHSCTADGGHDLAFFWQRISRKPRDAAPAFQRAFNLIGRQIAPGLTA